MSHLLDLSLLFLRLGLTSFGGPAAHLAVMQEEIVERRGWMSRERFLDLISAANVVPGPNSTEVAIHVGYLRARWPGLIVAGVCFILPAALIVGALAALYVRFGRIAEVSSVLYAVKPVVIAIVVQAIWRLGRTALRTRMLIAVCIAATAAVIAGADELLVLACAAVVMMMIAGVRGRGSASASMILAMPAAGAAGAAVTAGAGLLPLFLFFLKVGSVLFGSGYVLLAFLRADLVERLHWITDRQLLDAIAIGQVTPGPVFTTATFIGYLLHGPAGAVLATIGIFAPAFLFVAVSGPLLSRVRKSARLSAALDGVNAASLALMIAVTIQLGRSTIVDVSTAAIAAVSAALLLTTRINPTWLLAIAGVAGWVIAAFF